MKDNIKEIIEEKLYKAVLKYPEWAEDFIKVIQLAIKKESMNAYKNKEENYMVALEVGGVMEQPHFTYQDIEVIKANSPEEAEKIYNLKNECSYFYGRVIGKNGVRFKFDEPYKGNSFS